MVRVAMITAAITVVLAAQGVSGGSLKLFQSEDSSRLLYPFTSIPAERCYTFARLSSQFKYATWANIQEVAWVAFYAESQCNGEVTKFRSHDSSFNPDSSEKYRSLMILESSMYPTRGIKEIELGGWHSARH